MRLANYSERVRLRICCCDGSDCGRSRNRAPNVDDYDDDDNDYGDDRPRSRDCDGLENVCKYLLNIISYHINNIA